MSQTLTGGREELPSVFLFVHGRKSHSVRVSPNLGLVDKGRRRWYIDLWRKIVLTGVRKLQNLMAPSAVTRRHRKMMKLEAGLRLWKLVKNLETRCWKLDEVHILKGRSFSSLQLRASGIHNSLYNHKLAPSF